MSTRDIIEMNPTLRPIRRSESSVLWRVVFLILIPDWLFFDFRKLSCLLEGALLWALLTRLRLNDRLKCKSPVMFCCAILVSGSRISSSAVVTNWISGIATKRSVAASGRSSVSGAGSITWMLSKLTLLISGPYSSNFSPLHFKRSWRRCSRRSPHFTRESMIKLCLVSFL